MSLIFGWCFISTGNENLDSTVFCFLIKQYVQLRTISICQAFKPVAFYNISVWFSTYVDQGREKNCIFLNLEGIKRLLLVDSIVTPEIYLRERSIILGDPLFQFLLNSWYNIAVFHGRHCYTQWIDTGGTAWMPLLCLWLGRDNLLGRMALFLSVLKVLNVGSGIRQMLQEIGRNYCQDT